MSILENHTVKYKPFVNPFYKEGIGRRTGAVLKTEVRKDSDGFEIFDDYFSESEADNSELSFAVDKENISAVANRSKRTGKQKLPANQKRSSPLRPMKSFSPAASTDRSVVKSSDDISTSKNEDETQGNSGYPERKDTDAGTAQNEVAGNSEAGVSLPDKPNRESSSEEEEVPGLEENKTVPSRGVVGNSEAEIQPSDKETSESSSEEKVVPELEENKTVPSRGVAGNSETEIQLSDKETSESSSEEEAVPGVEENKAVPSRGVAGKSKAEIQPSDKEKSESSSEEEAVPGVEENKAVATRGVAQEDESEEVREVEREPISEDEDKIVTSKKDHVQDVTEKEGVQGEEESEEDGVSSERSSSCAEEGKMKNPEDNRSSVKKQPNVDSPLQAQIFTLTKKRLSFSCATEDVPTSSHKEESKVAMNKDEKMNNILENPDKEELVGESQEKPSFMDMINSKRTSGAIFSFRFSEILSSTANVSDHQSDQPDDDNVVIVSEENEKSFFRKTSCKPGTKESAKSMVDVKEKSGHRGKSKGAEKRLKSSRKGKAKSGCEESGSNQTVVAELETKDEMVQKEESLEKSRIKGGIGENEDSVQDRQVNLDGTYQVSGARKGTAGNNDGSHNAGIGASEDTDINHLPDVDVMEGDDQVFIEASEVQSMTEIRKEDSKRRRSSRTRKSTSRAKKEEEKVPLESVKEDSRTEMKDFDSKKPSEMEKMAAVTKGSSDEDEDQIIIGDATGQSTTEARKENTMKRKSSRRLKSTSKAKKEKNNQSRVKEDSRIERDGSVSKVSSHMEKTAAAEVNSDEDEIVIGDSESHGKTGTEEAGTRKRRSSRPLKSTSKAKKERKNNQSKVKEDSKMEKKGSNSEMPPEVEKMAASEGNFNEEDQIVIGDLEDGSTRVGKKTEGSVSKMSSEMDVKKTTKRKKSVSTAAKGRRKSKKQESDSASQEDEGETLERENAATYATEQRRSKRIRSKTQSESGRGEGHCDEVSKNLQMKNVSTKEDNRGKEMEGKVGKDGSSSSEEAEALKEQKSSSQDEDDCNGMAENKKVAKKSQGKGKKANRSKSGKTKSLSEEEGIENGKNSQHEGTKSKGTRRTTSLASYLHDNKGDEETQQNKEIGGESDNEHETVANEDGVQEDSSEEVRGAKSQGDRNDPTDDLQVEGSSRKRKSTSLHSTKTKVKRGDKSKVERIKAVKKTLDYTEEENSDREDVVDDGGEVVDNDGTVEGDGVPTDHEPDKTSPDKVSPSKEKEQDAEEKDDEKNNTSDQQQTGQSIPQSILKSSKVYRKHRKHRRQRNLRLTFHEIAKPKAWIIPPNREQEGTRRSSRNRVRPLEYWRNERAIYERRKSGGFALMGVNSPEYPSEPYQKTRTGRKKQRVGMHTRLLTPKNLSLHRSAPDDAVPGCSDPVVVVNPETQREVLVDVVKTPQSNVYVGPSGNHASDTDSFVLTKALIQPAFSSGILTIRSESEKGLQLVQRDTMVFHIVRGKLAVTIHQTTQILESGAFFFVPQGNVYNIVNLRKDDAKLVFFQHKGSIDV